MEKLQGAMPPNAVSPLNFQRVHVMGGDRAGWALDTEVRLAQAALQGTVRIVPSALHASVLHTVCPEELVESRVLRWLEPRQNIVAVFSNDPEAMFERVAGLRAAAENWFCVAQSSGAFSKLQRQGLKNIAHVPYIADLEGFSPVTASRAAYGIPENAYVIGSFQRDSDGSDLSKPKLQKGPDIFADIVAEAHLKLKDRLHVLLAGPRRHYLRSRLKALKIPYTFVGRETVGDDFPENILNAAKIRELTSLLNVYLVSSRWEGAPRAIFETLGCKKPVISTDVGVAKDILDSKTVFENTKQAVDLIVADASQPGTLQALVSSAVSRLQKNHSIATGHEYWRTAYLAIDAWVRSRPQGLGRIPYALPYHFSQLFRTLR